MLGVKDTRRIGSVESVDVTRNMTCSRPTTYELDIPYLE